MLSSLLQTIKPSNLPRQANTQFESLNEDAHTFSLLFPDGNGPRRYELDGQTDLQNPSRSSTSSNDWPLYNDVDLAFPRDIRILIAQAGTSFANAALIYDSKPSPAPDSAKSSNGRHVRTPSRSEQAAKSSTAAGRGRGTGATSAVSSIPESPVRHHRRTSSAFSTSGAFERRARRSSISSSHGSLESSSDHNRDKDDIERIALSCMFENATSSYKGTSNKVHVVPLASKPYEGVFMSQSLGSELSTSYIKPQLVRKPSALSKSHMPDDISLPQMTPEISKASQNETDGQNETNRRIVLVTRTFSISWMEDDTSLSESGLVERETNGHNAKQHTANAAEENIRLHGRIFRSPMYAVTLVLRLPIQTQDFSPSISRSSTFGRSTVRRDSSSRSAISFGSFESDRRGHWPSTGSYSGLDAVTSIALGTDVDDRVDLIGQHWDVLSRTLSTLQTLTQNKLLELLRPVARSSRNLRVPANVLCKDEYVSRVVEECGLRVIRGMRLPRARTGHGLWPAWREEARWLGSWSSRREDNLFLQVLLSAFLGTHTDWMQSLAPKAYRRKFKERQRILDSARMPLPSRTIIVSSDKMAARRLIFILAAFLPTAQTNHVEGLVVRPGSSSSFRAYSQSPPSTFVVSRQQSLRRTINKPGKPRAADLESYASSITATSELVDDRTETGTIRPSASEGHMRRPSDAPSIRMKLSMLDIDSAAQKSTATASPTTPDSVIVKPHFARQSSFGGEPLSAHSRSSSNASANLLQPLQKSSSIDLQNRSWNPFGKLFGNSQRRPSGSQYVDVSQTTDEDLGNHSVRGVSKLQQMVDEAHSPSLKSSRQQNVEHASKVHITSFDPPEGASLAQSTTAGAAQPIDVPLKMSVNREDGVIDVEIPFGEFGSPTILSPTLPGDLSSSSFGDSSFGQNSMLIAGPKESTQTLNVSGWLDKIHPDFTLQAIKPYPDMLRDAKGAMSAEPTPVLEEVSIDGSVSFEKWVDICTTLVADTNQFTVTRIHLRRLVRYVRNTTSPNAAGPHLPRSQSNAMHRDSTWSSLAASALELTEYTLEERFEEVLLTSLDREFVEVLERITGMSTNSSTAQSNASSRSSSRRGRTPIIRDNTTESENDNSKDCQRLIIGRLESIIATEIQDMAQSMQHTTVLGRNDQKAPLPQSNYFRTGIRQWLSELDAKKSGRSGDNTILTDSASRSAGLNFEHVHTPIRNEDELSSSRISQHTATSPSPPLAST